MGFPKMKYIRFQTLGIIIFPPKLRHENIARKFADTPISAGSIKYCEESKQFRCYGKSTTLNLCAQEDDSSELLSSGILIPHHQPQY